MDDEIANRLINVLKGGAYLIAASVSGAATLLTLAFLVASSPFAKNSFEWSVPWLLLGITLFTTIMFGYSLHQMARKLLDR